MVRFIDVTKTYDTGNEALRGVSFRIDDGEFVFLVGPSGSGKSTVTKLITGEIEATDGKIMVNGYNLGNIRKGQIPLLRRTLGIVFQDFRLMNNKTVWENLAFVMRVVGSSPHAMRKRIPYVLELVGLQGKERELPSQLSGGEQQRLAIARALVNNPEMIIADEPTANVDPGLSVEIMELLAQINDLGTTVLVVTHEKGLVDRLGKRVIAIRDGRILRDGTGGYYPEAALVRDVDEEEAPEEPALSGREPVPSEPAEGGTTLASREDTPDLSAAADAVISAVVAAASDAIAETIAAENAKAAEGEEQQEQKADPERPQPPGLFPQPAEPAEETENHSEEGEGHGGN